MNYIINIKLFIYIIEYDLVKYDNKLYFISNFNFEIRIFNSKFAIYL